MAESVEEQVAALSRHLNRLLFEGDGDGALEALVDLARAKRLQFTADGLSRFVLSLQECCLNDTST